MSEIFRILRQNNSIKWLSKTIEVIDCKTKHTNKNVYYLVLLGHAI